MSWDRLAKIRPQVEYKFWAGLGHEGQEVPDLIGKLVELGMDILEVDWAGRRVLVAKASDRRWGCTLCLANQHLTIVDNEQELAHHVIYDHQRAYIP